MIYRIIKEGKRDYKITAEVAPNSNYPDKVLFRDTLWGAKRAVKKLKKHYAYCSKKDLPKVIYEEVK